MSELLTQLGTLIGVVIGAAATFVVTAAGARAQWNREQHARMEDRKLDACVAYIDVTTRVFDLSLRLARTHGLPTNSGPIELELGLNQLTEAAIERSQCWYRLRLVGDPATIAASRDWQHTVWEVEKYARGDLSDQTKFREAVDHARHARANFHETARRSLGIKDEEPLEETSPVQQQSAATALSSIDLPSPDSGG